MMFPSTPVPRAQSIVPGSALNVLSDLVYLRLIESRDRRGVAPSVGTFSREPVVWICHAVVKEVQDLFIFRRWCRHIHPSLLSSIGYGGEWSIRQYGVWVGDMKRESEKCLVMYKDYIPNSSAYPNCLLSIILNDRRCQLLIGR